MNYEDDLPVTGGVTLGGPHFAVTFPRDIKIRDELDLHIVRLCAIHPKIAPKFRSDNLAEMDRETKLMLIQDINEALGIKPFNTRG